MNRAAAVSAPVTADLLAFVDDHGQCPGCGQGRGRPHFERCSLPEPFYGRELTRSEIRGLTDWALGTFPIDVVRRSTIRAMLPRGRTYGHPTPEERKAGKVSKNAASNAFREELGRMKRLGAVRLSSDCVVILARETLMRHARGQLRLAPDLVPALRTTLASVAAGLPEELTVAGRAQRDAELRALKRLMEETPASGPHQGRGFVRLVGKPRMLP